MRTLFKHMKTGVLAAVKFILSDAIINSMLAAAVIMTMYYQAHIHKDITVIQSTFRMLDSDGQLLPAIEQEYREMKARSRGRH